MAPILIQDLLEKKRDGEELSAAELDWFAKQVAARRVDECQIGAMLMAMCIQGLSPRETSDLTRAMLNSGEVLKWDESWAVVDKHSTGGVGDKVSLVLAPALASFGLKVPMLSGRGLEHTGGTLDKLESIPGFMVQKSVEELEQCLIDAGCFIAGASETIVPADKILYSLRDATCTTYYHPLIVGSIISKKVASGSKILVMDMKVGEGAFLKTLDDSKNLAKELIRVSKDLGVTTRAVFTKMDNPIGKGIGNALEVEDAIECMRGNGTEDLVELVAVTGGLILLERGIVKNHEDGISAIRESLTNGKALESFRKMIICQGVAEDKANKLCMGYTSEILPAVPASHITPMQIQKKGTITKINALKLGKAVWLLGAGRSFSGQKIDYRVGMWLTHFVGHEVDVGDVWAEVHHAEPILKPEIKQLIEESITIAEGKVEVDTSLVIEIM